MLPYTITGVSPRRHAASHDYAGALAPPPTNISGRAYPQMAHPRALVLPTDGNSECLRRTDAPFKPMNTGTHSDCCILIICTNT